MKLLYLVESGESKFLVFDEMPDKISTKYGDDTIIGRIGGIFYDFLAKRNGRREAFGGRKFDIILDNGKVEKCEGQWWDAVTDRAKEELEKEGNPFSKMMLIGVSSVDRLLDCYVYCGLWASESKIEEMIADYKGRIYEYYEFREEVIDRINETIRKSYIQSWKEQIIRSGMRRKKKEILRSFDFTVTKMAYYKEPKYEEKEDDYFPFSSASIVAYEYKLLYHEKFFEHLHMKRLVIDENIPFPVSTWERSYRYKGYGYNMCRETKKKLLQAIKGVNVEEEDVSLYTTGGWD